MFYLLASACSFPSIITNPTDVANVLDFDAVGNGVVDDIVALERALASVASRGGTVYLPAGYSFGVSRPLVLSGYSLALRGGGAHPAGCVGKGASMVALGTNSTLVVVEHCTFCEVSGMLLAHAMVSPADANASANANAAATTCTAATSHRRMRVVAQQRRRIRRRGRSNAVAAAADAMRSRLLLLRRVTPTGGAAIWVKNSFEVKIHDVWIEGAWIALLLTEFANTVSFLDAQISNIVGPAGIRAQGGGSGNGTRVDILQVSRLTTNNDDDFPDVNQTCVWIDIGTGVNTVRLDNVGLINGGIGVRMDAPADSPAGESPGRPLFLIANDLEIDFPKLVGVALLRGESVQLANMYLQGAGSGSGLLIGEGWNSEVMVTNSRIFGHARSGIELLGGVHTIIANNVIGDNSNVGRGVASGIFVAANVSDFIISNNHIGAVFSGQGAANTKWGIEIEKGNSARYVITGNTVVGNVKGGVCDAATTTEDVEFSVEGNVPSGYAHEC